MSEGEEMAWARRKCVQSSSTSMLRLIFRHKEVLKSDGPLILSSSDPRSQRVSRVATRLVTAMEEQDHHVVCDAAWPPRSQDLSRVMSEREAGSRRGEGRFEPSGTAQSTFMPYRPTSSNPLKRLETADWNLYVIDLVGSGHGGANAQPQINAFALPSKDIFVYTGLLDTLPDDDALLAAILGHEIAHVAQRHSVENLGVSRVSWRVWMKTHVIVSQRGRGRFRRPTRCLFRSHYFLPIVGHLRNPADTNSITDSAGLFINWLNDVVAERAYSR